MLAELSQRMNPKKLKVAYVVIVLGLIAFLSGSDILNNHVKGFIINIKDKKQNHFLSEQDVMHMIEEIRKKDSTLLKNEHFSLKTLEDRLKAMEFIQSAEVYRDLKGNVVIDIRQDEPIARVMTESGKGGYITQDQEIISLSSNYASRVLIITGEGADSLFIKDFFKTPKGAQLFQLIDFIYHHPLWKMQIAQLDLNPMLEVTMYPQLGKQLIELGEPVKIREKFKKLTLFYEQIVPYKGWNAYDKVKLQYDGQIVCEK